MKAVAEVKQVKANILTNTFAWILLDVTWSSMVNPTEQRLHRRLVGEAEVA